MNPVLPFKLPSDTLVNIAFYIETVDILFALLEALRPAYDLGVLEHVWQLYHQLHWKKNDLWSRLSLTEAEESSLVHLEPIIKHYSEVAVNDMTQVEWFCPLIDPTTRITWTPRRRRLDPTDLVPWKSFRITRVDPWFEDCNQPLQTLLLLPHLEEIDCNNCNNQTAEAIFKFAATSSNLRSLKVRTGQRSSSPAWITSEMADDIMQWNISRPIEVFRLWKFKWDSQALRDQVVASVLGNPALEEFTLDETLDDIGNYGFCAYYNREDHSLKFTLSDANDNQASAIDQFTPAMAVFAQLLRTKITKFCLVESWIKKSHRIWSILAPLLQECPLETLSLELTTFTVDDVRIVTQVFANFPTLKAICLLNLEMSFKAAKLFLQTAPASVKIVSIRSKGATRYSNKEWRVLQNIAVKKSIHLDCMVNVENKPKAHQGCRTS
ncbi:hypothetical protein LEN26_006680 [Aphanomyces euteiches]|nr:hypothetical protein LEN26_006680 [Aphanomyces euteiches]